MNKKEAKDITKPPFNWLSSLPYKQKALWEGTSSWSFHSTKKDIIMKTSSLDILCATDEEEFYYKVTDELVEEGDPVGVDIDNGNEVELVLFSNIYWKPNYE